MTTLSKRLKDLRYAQSLSQIEVATRAKMPPGRYWKIEAGYLPATADDLRKLSRAFKVRQRDLAPREAAPIEVTE